MLLDLFVLLALTRVGQEGMVVWRCVITTPGGQYVGTLDGTITLPRWCVVSLALVSYLKSHDLIGVTTPTSFEQGLHHHTVAMHRTVRVLDRFF